MAMTKLLQGIMDNGRRARIEIKDMGLRPPSGRPVMRCRMMQEGDEVGVFEFMSESQMLDPLGRFQDALTHLGENGVFLPSLQVLDANRGFEAVMRPAAMRKLGLV